MNMTKEQVAAGIAAGLALTDPNGDVRVPMKYCAGALILRELLVNLAGGILAIVSTEVDADEKTPNDSEEQRKKDKDKK